MSDIRAIQYLGSKLNLKEIISKAILDLSKDDSVIVDGFAGTGVVGNELKDKFKIISNDSQEYSYLINKVLLDSQLTITANNFSMRNLIIDSIPYNRNRERLHEIFLDALKFEEQVKQEEDTYNLALLTESEIFYNNFNFKFQKNLPEYKEINAIYNSTFSYFSDDHLNSLRQGGNDYMMFSLYYLNGYFSLSQCIEIDSIRCAIDAIPNEKEKNLALFLLLHAVSEATSAVGKQFAQPIRLFNNKKEVKTAASKRCLRDWNINIIEKMYQMLIRIRTEKKTAKYTNEIFNLDFSDLVDELSERDNLIYYLDPPYTIDHYSRFYHVLESLIKYDYPILDTKTIMGEQTIMRGRYRNDRIQSNYSIPSKAPFEFDDVLKKISQSGGKVVLSYSEASGKGRPRLISKDDLLSILESYFIKTDYYEINHTYRRLNKEELNNSSNLTRELLFIGENDG